MARASHGSENPGQMAAAALGRGVKNPARESGATGKLTGKTTKNPGSENRATKADPHEASEVAACRASGAFSIEPPQMRAEDLEWLRGKKTDRVAYEPGERVVYGRDGVAVEPQYLSLAEVADVVSTAAHRVSVASVRVWIRSGVRAKGVRKNVEPVRLRATRMPYAWVVKRADLDAFVEAMTRLYGGSPVGSVAAVAKAPEIGKAVYPEARGRKGVA